MDYTSSWVGTPEMRKFFLLISLLVGLSLFVPMGMVLASYDYYIPITIYNNGTEDLAGIPVLVVLNNSQLADLGYILSSGLDTEVVEGATSRSYMVADARLGLVVPSLLGYQSRTYHYRLGVDPAQTDFLFIAGSGGYVNTTDHADLELGTNFNITYDGWVDTSCSPGGYPSIDATNTSTTDTRMYPHIVALPSGITDGDLLIITIGAWDYQYDDPSITWPEDWTGLMTEYDSYRAYGVAYRVADGSEGSTVTITLGADCVSAHQSFRVSAYRGIPEISYGGVATTSTPDPPSLTPSWGALSTTLWIAGFVGGDATSASISSYPTNYTDGQFTKSADVSGYGYASSAERSLAASSEDPGEFTVNVTVGSRAFTVGIRGTKSLLLINKPGAFNFENTALGELTARILGGSPKTLIVSGVSSDEYLIDIWADGITFGIDIDGVTENSTTVSSVPDNSYDWLQEIPGYVTYNHTVNGTQEVWYQPITMILGTSLLDRTGNGHTGEITWGNSPSAIEVTIGGIQPYSAFTAVEEGEVEIPSVVPIPGGIEMAPSIGATGEGLPLQANFQRAADSLEWALPTTYAVMFMFVAIAMGVGGMVAIGSVWGWVVGFGGTAAFFGAVRDVGGYAILPMWFVIACVAFAILTGYVWRYT